MTTSVLDTSARFHPARVSALAAPLLLLGYGVLRLIDGLDGNHGPGLWWDAGHVAFLLAMLTFAVLAFALRRIVPGWPSDVAAGAVVVGTLAFVWVILGDLFPSFDDAVEVPDAVTNLGPIVFQLGMLTLLIRMVLRKLVPWWSPVLVLLGFVPIAVNLDLLPVGALVILAGLLPVARRR